MPEVNTELKNILESALLVAGQPLSINKLLSLFPEDSRPERDEIKATLKVLAEDYEDRGIELKQIDRSYRIQSKQKYAQWLKRLNEEKPPRYSRAALETLAIIAYRQPVTRADIEEIRGVSVSTEIIRGMTDREWVRQVGQRDVPGKPALYGTTREFLEYFNLKSLSEMPSLAELRDLEDISKDLNMSLEFADKNEDDSAVASTRDGDDANAEAGSENDADEQGDADSAEDTKAETVSASSANE
ncbi:MAG: hypothetical protein BMS9Abin36_1224 [Gammaproteobacteria bacterium]|nr:MAG: hypothetical protein BMS9Abin36_1224 [Gammaproteobacteria bacterium]